MERNELLEQIHEVITKVVNHDDFTMNEELSANDVDGWDSLSHMLIISSIEDHFAIKFKMRELSKMNKVGDLIDVIMNKM